MQRTFDLLDQLERIVERQSGAKAPEMMRNHSELRTFAGDTWRRKTPAKGFVRNLAKGPARSPHFGLQFRGDVLVEGKRRSHALMLARKHHDVNMVPESTDAADSVTRRV